MVFVFFFRRHGIALLILDLFFCIYCSSFNNIYIFFLCVSFYLHALCIILCIFKLLMSLVHDILTKNDVNGIITMHSRYICLPFKVIKQNFQNNSRIYHLNSHFSVWSWSLQF